MTPSESSPPPARASSPEREFRAERVVSRGLSIFFRNFVPFILITAVIYSPLIIATGVVVGGDLTADSVVNLLLAISLGGVVAQTVASGAVTHGTIAHLRGQRATVGQCLIVGFKRLLPIVGVGIIVGVATMFGFLLLVIPGIIVMLNYWVAVPVTVVERTGVLDSMQRSVDLVRGHRWSVLAVAVLMLILSIGLNKLLGASVNLATLTIGELKMYLGAQLGVSLMSSAVSAVIIAVSYHDLRVAKEEIDAEQIARAILV